jgi:hypothetical protein
MGEWRYSSPIIILGDRGEWSAALLGLLAPREKAPGTHFIGRLGGWVGTRAGKDAME